MQSGFIPGRSVWQIVAGGKGISQEGHSFGVPLLRAGTAQLDFRESRSSTRWSFIVLLIAYPLNRFSGSVADKHLDAHQ